MATVALTVREQILNKMEEILKGASDAYAITNSLFNQVLRGNLDEVLATQCPAAGVDEGRERVTTLVNNVITKEMIVYFEVKFSHALNVDPYRTFNYYVGQVEKLLLAPNVLGNLIVAIYAVGSMPQVEGRHDPLPGGHFIANVLYRHINGDPYTNA